MPQPLTGLGSAAQTNALLAAASKQTGIAPPSTPFAQAGTLGTIVHEDAQSTTYKNGSNTQTVMKPGFETVDTLSPRAQAKLLASHGTSPDAQAAYQQALSGTNIGGGAQDVVGQLGALQNNIGQGSTDQYLQDYLNSIGAGTSDPALMETQKQLKAIESQQAGVNASRDLGIADINTQPIAQQFLSGQSRALQDQAAAKMGALGAQAVPLQQQLATQQARLQSAVDISKAKLDYSQKQSELNKPFSVAMGSSVYNPKTGQMSASNNMQADQLISDAINSGRLDPSQITRYNTASVLAALQDDPNHNFTGNKVAFTQAQANSTQWHQDAFGNWFSTQTKPGASGVGGGATTSGGGGGSGGGGYQAGQLTQLLQSQGKSADDATLKSLWSQYGNGGAYNNDTAHNSLIYKAMGGQSSSSSGASSGGGIPTSGNPKAVAAAITDQLKQQSDVTRAIGAADDNFQLLTDSFKGKVNDFNSPLMNQVNNLLQNRVLGNTDVINFQSAVSTLQTEYAAVLGRGGDVTDAVRKSAQNVVNGNYSMNDLISLHDYIAKEGKNVIANYDKVIKNLKTTGTASGNSNSSSNSPASGGGGSNPLGI